MHEVGTICHLEFLLFRVEMFILHCYFSFFSLILFPFGRFIIKNNPLRKRGWVLKINYLKGDTEEPL